MLTREQIEGIRTESREKGVSIKNMLEEKGVLESQYFFGCLHCSPARAGLPLQKSEAYDDTRRGPGD